MSDDLFDSTADGSLVLRVQVHPGAGRTTVVGRHGDALKVKVAAPPDQGRANDACVALVAEIAGVAATAVTVTSGTTSRTKRLTITGVTPEEFTERLDLALDGSPLGGRGGGRDTTLGPTRQSKRR